MSAKNKYYKWFQANCKSVDFCSFSGIKTKILKYMKDPECPAETKLLFGTFLLKTIYMMYKFRGSDKTAVTDMLINPITECKNVISKGEYLKYHDLEAMSLLSLHFYLNRFKDRENFFILQLLNDTQLIKGYLQRSDISDKSLLEHFLSWVERAPVDEQRSNILDVLLRYYPKDERVIILHEEMKFGKGAGVRKDVFNDAQNVHDEEINSSVLNVAENLIEWGLEQGHGIDISPPLTAADWVRSTLFNVFTDHKHRQIIECCLQRCTIDTTSFGSGFTISDIFFTTVKYITLSPNAKDIYSIFMEEMDSMKELCASGYVARCLTTLQGQDIDGRFDIKIPFSKKLHSLISMRIMDGIKNANDNVVLGTYDEEFKTCFLDYVAVATNAYLPSVIKSNTLEEVEQCICVVLHKITASKWSFDRDLVRVAYIL